MKAKHGQIIEFYMESSLDKIESMEQAKELKDKLNAVIERLINKESILIVTTDDMDKNERVLSLNVNYDPAI
jgi:hypothetical protein